MTIKNKEHIELKTLKDMPNMMKTTSDLIHRNELKREAIKWVKLCQRDLKRTSNKDREEVMFLNGEIWWIKHFFNLK